MPIPNPISNPNP